MSSIMHATPRSDTVDPVPLPRQTEHPTSIVLEKVATDYPVKSLYDELRLLFAEERQAYGENVLGGLRVDAGGVPNRYTVLVWLDGDAIRNRVQEIAQARGYSCSIYPDDAWYRHETREPVTADRASVWDCLRY